MIDLALFADKAIEKAFFGQAKSDTEHCCGQISGYK